MKTRENFACFVLANKGGQGERPSILSYHNTLKEAEAAQIRLAHDQCSVSDRLEAIPWKAFLERLRRFYLRDPEEVSLEYWNLHLRMLPPLNWEVADGVERFMCPEFLDWNFTRQYARLGDRYFTRIVDVGDKSTWITAAQVGELINR